MGLVPCPGKLESLYLPRGWDFFSGMGLVPCPGKLESLYLPRGWNFRQIDMFSDEAAEYCRCLGKLYIFQIEKEYVTANDHSLMINYCKQINCTWTVVADSRVSSPKSGDS